jgi:hypothetical protein
MTITRIRGNETEKSLDPQAQPKTTAVTHQDYIPGQER